MDHDNRQGPQKQHQHSPTLKRRGRPPGSKNIRGKASSLSSNRLVHKGRVQNVIVPSVAELLEQDYISDEDVDEQSTSDASALAPTSEEDQVVEDLTALRTAAQTKRYESIQKIRTVMNSLSSAGVESSSSVMATPLSVNAENKISLERTLYVQSCSYVHGVDVWPSQTDVPCWHCKQSIVGTPMRHCSSIDWDSSIKKHVLKDVYGWWCNPACLRRYLEQKNVPNIGHEFMVISRVIHLVLGMSMQDTYGCAPPWQALRPFGPMTPQEFKQASIAASGVHVHHLDRNILIPSVMLFEATKKNGSREENTTGENMSVSSAAEEEEWASIMLTRHGLRIDEASGGLVDSHFDPKFLRQKDEWLKFKATGYAFQSQYSVL